MKRFTEIVCEMYTNRIKEPMKTIVVRPGNLYGPYDKFDWEKSKVIPAIMRRAIEKHHPLEVWGDGMDLKDFLYIDDCIDGLILAMENLNEFQPINIASGIPVTIKDVLSQILKSTDYVYADIQYDISKPTMIPKRLIDISLAKEKLGFEPKVSLQDGIYKTVRWYKEYYKSSSPEEKIMIISRTPFRVSFFGGGTDYPVWYRENGGTVISSTINQYCYVTLRELPPFFKYKHRFRYFEREEVNSIDEIKHPSIRECLKYLNINKNVDLVHHADLPAQSGLGSSSTFTVGLLMAGYAFNNQMRTKSQLAHDAIEIEQRRIGEAVGSQDQTAAAFGGLNKINFGGYRVIEVIPLTISNEKVINLQDHLMLFFTGFSRNAPDVAQTN